MKELLRIVIIQALLLCSTYAGTFERTVDLPFSLLGTKIWKSPAKTLKTINGTECHALVLEGVAQCGRVYYLSETNTLLLENAVIEIKGTTPFISTSTTEQTNIAVRGRNLIKGEGTLINIKGSMTISGDSIEMGLLLMRTQQVAIQCGNNLTLKNMVFECPQSDFAFNGTGRRSREGRLTFVHSMARIKAVKNCVTGFKNLASARCGLPYAEYDDQYLSYDKREAVLLHNYNPCKELYITCEETYIPINTFNSTYSWSSKNVKPEKPAVEADDRIYGPGEIDSAPQFPGGQAALQQHIKDNMFKRDSDQPASQPQESGVKDSGPEFIGGNEAFSKFISENISYPVIALENGIQGHVVVQFTVEKDGSLSDIVVLKPVDNALDKEAVRVIGLSSGRWKPGIKDGRITKAQMTYPVMFRLSSKK